MIWNLIVWVVIGGVAGWLASIVMGTNKRQGCITDIIVGIVGGLLGGAVLRFLGFGAAVTGINIPSLLTAVIGAVLLLAILRFIRRR